MQDRKLEQALEIYFQENPDRESDKISGDTEIPEAQNTFCNGLLIENEDTEGWSRSRNADGFRK